MIYTGGQTAERKEKQVGENMVNGRKDRRANRQATIEDVIMNMSRNQSV